MRSSLNILSLYGDRLPYNVCRNLEWQICAANGLVPGQGSRIMKFAKAPNTLDVSHLGECHGWGPRDRPSDFIFGYATADIFFLEVCLFNQVCRNHAALFALRQDEAFECDFSPSRFAELQQLLTSPWREPDGAMQCTGADRGYYLNSNSTASSRTGGDCSREKRAYQQCGGREWTGETCCPPSFKCEGDVWYKQCRELETG